MKRLPPHPAARQATHQAPATAPALTAAFAALLAALLLAAPVAAGPPDPAARIELRAGAADSEEALSMRRWHRRYRKLITPVVHAWDELARSAGRPHPAERMLTGCRELGSALAATDREALLRAPDTAVAVHLDATLRSLASASRSCEQGAYFLTTWRLRQAAGAWAELASRLALHGLGP